MPPNGSDALPTTSDAAQVVLQQTFGRKSKPCHHQQPQSNMLDPVEGPSTWLQHEQPPREKTSSTNSANSVPKTTEPSHMHSRNPQMPTQRKQQVTCCLLLLPRLASLTTAAVRAGGQHAQKKPNLTVALPARTGKKQRETVPCSSRSMKAGNVLRSAHPCGGGLCWSARHRDTYAQSLCNCTS